MTEMEKFLSHTIIKKSDRITFGDVIGQEKAKGALNEMVILPAQVSALKLISMEAESA